MQLCLDYGKPSRPRGLLSLAVQLHCIAWQSQFLFVKDLDVVG